MCPWWIWSKENPFKKCSLSPSHMMIEHLPEEDNQEPGQCKRKLEKALKRCFFLNSLWQQLFWWILNSPCLSEYPKCPKPSEAKVVGQMIIKETTCQCIKFLMMMIMKETQKRLQKMPVLFWVMKLAAFVRRVWNNQHIVDGHGELASTTTKKLRASD